MDKQSASNDIKKPKYIKPRSCMITGGVELVPLLAKRRAMQRPISLSTTDVTRQMSNNNQNEMYKINIHFHFHAKLTISFTFFIFIFNI